MTPPRDRKATSASASVKRNADPSARFWRQAPRLLERLNRANAALSVSESVPADVRTAVEAFTESVPSTPEAFSGSDPYLVEALLIGALHCRNALWIGDDAKARQELRLPLERARQALRDLLAEATVSLDQPAKDVLVWLVENTEVSRADLARILNVEPRTLQRWISQESASGPTSDAAMRVRVLARVVSQLRWSMTGTGVVRWLERPHPQLDGKRPATLLNEPDAFERLPRLARSVRAMTAT